MMKRKAGIGIGNKYDFTKNGEGVPPPNRYKIRDFVQYNIQKAKGKSLGLGRDVVKVNSWQISSSGFPGAGKYPCKSQLKKMPAYSLRKKFKDPRKTIIKKLLTLFLNRHCYYC